MIARVWHGVTRAEHSAEYAHYLEESGIRQARANEGSRGTLVLRRTRGDYAEFETILLFDSLEDVKRFAGDDLEAAVFFPEDERYLVDRDLDVRHYEVDAHMTG